MQVNSVNNFNTRHNQSFGAIHNIDAVKDILMKKMVTRDIQEFMNIVDKQKGNNLVDINLFGNNNNKLSANVFYTNLLNKEADNLGQGVFSYAQRFYESPLGFLCRAVRKVEKMTEKAQDIIAKRNLLEGQKTKI